MITCIAIDDEPLALAVIRKYCGDIPTVSLVDTFTDAIQAQAFLRIRKVDLLILDIQMPDISGIQLMQSLKEPPMVVFTTAHSQYAVKGFELEAVDYLVKPIKFERFVNAVEKARKLKTMQQTPTKETEEGFLFVKSGYGIVRMVVNDILYIEGLDDYIRIHFTDNQKPILSQMSLKSILEKLPAGRFMRVHRSFIVAVKEIKSVRNKVIFLDKVKIPVGETYNESVQTWLSGF
jgi:DNA-binding LytR/AlgR family response regulator